MSELDAIPGDAAAADMGHQADRTRARRHRLAAVACALLVGAGVSIPYAMGRWALPVGHPPASGGPATPTGAATADAVVPRVAGMKDILAAAKKPVEVLSLAELSVAEPGAVLTTLATAKPGGAERTARIFDGSDAAAAATELVGALRQSGAL